MLGDCVGLETLDTALGADATVLPAPERGLGQVRETTVYRHRAVLKRIDQTAPTLAVMGEHVGRQAKFKAVRGFKHCLLVPERQDRRHRAEGLLMKEGCLHGGVVLPETPVVLPNHPITLAWEADSRFTLLINPEHRMTHYEQHPS